MAEDPALGEQVKITLLATGFGIQDIHMKEMDQRLEQRSQEEQKRLAELEEKEEERRRRRESYYGRDTSARYQPVRRRHIYLFTPEDLDNADVVALVENSPTCRRDKATLNAIRNKAEQERTAAIAAGTQPGEDEGVITF